MFGRRKCLGVERNGVQLAGRGRNGQNGCEHIVGGVSLDCNLGVQDPMSQDWSSSESLPKCIEGRMTLIGKVPLIPHPYINSDSFFSQSKITTIIAFINHGTQNYVSHHFVLNIFFWVHRQLSQTTIVSSYETIEEQHQ